MFTGLIETLARVSDLEPEPPGVRLVIAAGAIADETKIGDSIAVNGCCLTVVRIDGESLSFQAGEETLKRTNLGRLQLGSALNLERSLVIGDRLGGHFVTGHIDGQGVLAERRDDKDWSTVWFSAPAELLKQIASKGSIAVDGVSLTVVEVERERFSVALIPHTLAATTLGRLNVGDSVNLETDLIAKYVARLIESRADDAASGKAN
jgi:riboflavin synthase